MDNKLPAATDSAAEIQRKTFARGLDAGVAGEVRWRDSPQPHGLRRFAWFFGVLVGAYSWVLLQLALYAAGAELHSHILLIPFVSVWLIRQEPRVWPQECAPSKRWAAVFTVAGTAALVYGLITGMGEAALSRNDWLAVMVLSFLCFLAAGAFYLLGRKWLAVVAFPLAFLLFLIPLPDAVVDRTEHLLMAFSADAVDLLYAVAGIPYLRDGQVFQLPGITLRIAQECSGIRSSWVLVITSLVAACLFLRTPWRRALLVALVIPLGILRNAFRVLVLGWLCVRQGPHMIDSDIHHRGGPIFFAISLIPLFFLLWWLRRGEAADVPAATPGTGGKGTG
ncbi:MAG: exosortase VPDSG-CTERM-specific [Verrucomicrobiales bacterium]|nr:exosortase VPDSG-CTERM-specific [Verrucomicrobiales bacterium]